jgi:hypothetical protein
VKGEVVASDST